MEPIRSAARVVSVIELLANGNRMRLDEIAAVLGVHKSNALRLLATLRTSDWVTVDERDGSYHLGHGLIRIGESASSGFQMEKATSLAERLRDLTGETVHISIPAGKFMLIVGTIESHNPLRVIHSLGTQDPLHATAVGKVYLACQTDEHLAEIFKKIKLSQHTAHTITTKKDLLNQLGQIRRDGYAVNIRESIDDTTAIAVALDLQGDQQAPVCLSITGPAERLSEETMRGMASAILKIVEPFQALPEEDGAPPR
jgi:DNA-binding IclR family transcriptional regulator